jgi:hypothetical protein
MHTLMQSRKCVRVDMYYTYKRMRTETHTWHRCMKAHRTSNLVFVTQHWSSYTKYLIQSHLPELSHSQTYTEHLI